MRSMRLSVCLILVGLFAGAGLATDCPIDKGASMVEGRLAITSFGGDLYKDLDAWQIEGHLSYLKFVGGGFALGLNALWDSRSQEDLSRMLIGGGPELGVYFGGCHRKTVPFVRAGFTYAYLEYEAGPAKDAGSALRYTISIGATAFVSRNVGLVGALDFAHETAKYGGLTTVDQNRLGASLGLAAFLY